jgi:hypothetical protein
MLQATIAAATMEIGPALIYGSLVMILKDGGCILIKKLFQR